MFKGSITALVTPMRDGAFDEAGFRAFVDWQIAEGTHGLVPVGTTGESPTLSHAEHRRVVEVCIDEARGRVPVIAGAGSNNTAEAIDLARHAEKAGADAVLVVTPYYNKPPQEGLVAHFLAMADASSLPVMVYDIPGRAGIAIARDTYLRIAEHDRVVAVKDARADLWLASQVMTATGLDWYSGDDAMDLAHFVNGAVGFVGVTSQVSPAAYRRLADAVVEGRWDDARAVHRSLHAVVDAIMNVTQGAIMAKAGLALQGHLESDAVRLPLVPATAEQRDIVRAALATVAA